MSEPSQKIFVVDDNPEFRSLMVDFLTAQGYRVDGFGTAIDALAALHKGQAPEPGRHLPKLIISDVNMPGMSGVEFLKLVKKSPMPIPMILTSACASLDTIEEAKEAGAHGFLAKPFALTQMESIVRQALLIRPQA